MPKAMRVVIIKERQARKARKKIALKNNDLGKNKSGRIASKKKSLLGKKNKWIVAVNKARAALKIKAFSVVKKGTPLDKKAKEFMA